MLSLFRRSNGIYYLLTTENGKRKWTSTRERDKRLALRRANDLLERSEPEPQPVSQPPAPPLPSSSTLAGFRVEFLAYARTAFAPGTVDMYAHALGSVQTLMGDRPLGSVSARDADAYKARRIKEGRSPVSLNIELRTLRAAFQTAVRWGLLEKNPWKEVSLVRIPERQPVYFTREQFGKLLGAVRKPWLRDLIVACVSTGLRRGEVLNLRWSDVDWDSGVLKIQSSTAFRTKAGKRRAVPINETLRELLLRRLRSRTCDHVFTDESGPVRPDHFTHSFKKAVRAAGLPDALHVHSLRHSFATWLVQEGVSVYEIQQLLGHSTIRVTEVYAHLAPSQLRRAVDMLTIAP